MLVVEVIPYKSFSELMRITKAAKGIVTIEKNYVMIERKEYGRGI
jgi:hypothetical protein